MSEPPRQLVRAGFILTLVIAVGLVFILFIVPDPLPAGGRAKLPRVAANLKQIDLAKQMWAFDHAGTNGAIVTEQELMSYLSVPGRTGLVAVVDAEIYRVNAIGTPPEAQLEKPFGPGFPKGTLVRSTTNAGIEMLRPNPQGATNRWRPLSPGARRSHQRLPPVARPEPS